MEKPAYCLLTLLQNSIFFHKTDISKSAWINPSMIDITLFITTTTKVMNNGIGCTTFAG